MFDAVTSFLTFLVSTGKVGAIIAAVLVGLGLLLILYAQTAGIFDDRVNAQQKTDFQARLLDAIKMLNESETVLRRENGALRDDIGRLRVEIDLMRNQNRRIIDRLRAVVEGRVEPSSVDLTAETGGAS